MCFNLPLVVVRATVQTFLSSLRWRRGLAGLLTLVIPAFCHGQMTVRDTEDDYTYVSRRGLEFGLNIGVYRGDSWPAYFYDGSGMWELGDASGQIWGIEDRLLQLQQQQHPVRDILNDLTSGNMGWRLESLPLMQYRPAMMFGLKAVKFWNPESALVVSVDAMQMTAEGAWTLNTGQLPDQGQGNAQILTFPILGKERRLNVLLGYRTSAYMAEGVSWTFEAGGLANALTVEENYIMMWEYSESQAKRLDLLTAPANGNGTLGAANNLLTQWGTGMYVGGGLDLSFEEGGNIELNVRACRDNMRLGTTEFKRWNGALFVTWMIPSQLGDFVRASF
jgi:hypothetical protein